MCCVLHRAQDLNGCRERRGVVARLDDNLDVTNRIVKNGHHQYFPVAYRSPCARKLHCLIVIVYMEYITTINTCLLRPPLFLAGPQTVQVGPRRSVAISCTTTRTP